MTTGTVVEMKVEKVVMAEEATAVGTQVALAATVGRVLALRAAWLGRVAPAIARKYHSNGICQVRRPLLS